MARQGPTYSKLKKILERQGGAPRWGGDYRPANVIDDIHSPSNTRPSAIYDPRIDRYIQAQAKTERPFVLLAWHQPNCFELHEQKMLSFNPAGHPLAGHPLAYGLDLPLIRGTLAIADGMGELKRHPLVRTPSDHPTYPNQLVPYPYIGDLLLYLLDDEGPYCVNWSIKRSEADFHQTFQSRLRPTSSADQAAAEFRHELERLHYIDGEIPTHKLVPNMIDRELRINLLDLYYWWARSPEDARTRDVEQEMLAWYQIQIPKILVQFDLAKAAAGRFRTSVYDAKWVLKKGVFGRQLRVDLFRTVLDNLPLFPELEDPFERYAHWFARYAR